MSFFGDVLGFEQFNLKDMWRKVKEDPERLLLGAADPWSTKLWNKALGKDWEPIVDQMGGAYGGHTISAFGNTDGGVYERARQAGIDPKAGGQMHDAAHVISALYAGGYGAGKLKGVMGNQGLGQFSNMSGQMPQPTQPQQVPQPPPAQQRESAPMPSVTFGDRMKNWGANIEKGLGRFNELLLPADAAATAGMTPEQIKALRKQSMLQMGLGMLAAQNRGAGLGQALAMGYGSAQDNFKGASEQAYQAAKDEQARKRQEQRDAEERAQLVRENEHRDRTFQAGLDRDAAEQHRWEEGRKISPWQQAQLDEGARDRAARLAGGAGLGAPPAGYRWNPDGSLAAIPGGPHDPAKPPPGGGKLTEGEQRALSQVSRMNNAEAALQKSNYAPTGVGGAAAMWAAEAPGVGNIITSKKFQAYQQSAREWISGLLRYDSGAAVPETEFHRYFTTYFPQPGDSQQTIQQKNQSRQLAVQSMQMGLPQHGQARLDQGVPMPGGGTLHPRGSEPTGGADYDYVPGQGLMRAGR